MKNVKNPGFYNPDNAANFFYNEDLAKVKSEALKFAKSVNLKPSASDKVKINLLLIDVQRDFCHPEGTLYVGGRSGVGAIEDSKRIAQFIYKNVDLITKTTVTLDTHFPLQIFFSNFFVDKNGVELNPHTLIDVKEVSGKKYLINLDLAGNVINDFVMPNPRVALELGVSLDWLYKQCVYYCEQLKDPNSGRKKYTLYLWPEHCMIGTIGHTLVGVVNEARMFHAYARSSQPAIEIKGGHPLSENYSIVQPEVLTRFDGNPSNLQRNTKFLDHLLKDDIVIIAGQASSHCVASSIDDILQEILNTNPKLAEKIYILEDGTSAVAVPDGNGGFLADFTDDAKAAMDRFRAAGMHIVKSTDDMANWPGVAHDLLG